MLNGEGEGLIYPRSWTYVVMGSEILFGWPPFFNISSSRYIYLLTSFLRN